MSALPSALRLVVVGGASRNHRVGAARQVRGTAGTSVPNASAGRSPAERGVRCAGTSTCFVGCASRPTRSSTPVPRREFETALAGALPVPRETRAGGDPRQDLLADGPFAPVRGLLGRTWFLDVDPGLRRDRLVARHDRLAAAPRPPSTGSPAPPTAPPNSSRPPALAPTTSCDSSRGVDAGRIRRQPRRSGRCASPGPRAPARTGRRCPPAAAAAPCAATPRSRPRP